MVWLACACLSCFLASCDTKVDGLGSRARADFEWFSTLGFPDVKGCQCVRMEDGGSWTTAGEPIRIDYIDAFVLATNAGNLSLFALDLSTRNVTNAVQPKARLGGSRFEPVNLREEAHAQIKALQTRLAKDDPFRHFNRVSEERAEVFVLAWACWRQGLRQEAQHLYEQAQRMRARINGHGESSTFREALEKDFGHAMMWRAILSLGDPSVPRPEVLRQLEAILKHYPHSEHCERARQTAEVLKRMIAEDQAHATSGPKDLSAMPVEAQVGELIYRLRDQNGHQFMNPGTCDIFEDFRGTTNTPAHQLVRLGYAAVPQLIAALDSDTLTRSLGERRFSDSPGIVLTVGDCAEAILQRITAKSFFIANSDHSYMSEAGESSAARKAAEAWWREFQRKGEKQALMDAVAAAAHDAPAQAELLCQRYPNVATATLIRGAEAATNSSVRAGLVEQISKLGEAPGLAFLRAELLHGPLLESRVAAAFGLRQHGDQSAIAAMIREWQQGTQSEAEDDHGGKQVLEFLAGCDSVEAVSALTADLGRRPRRVKFEVIVALGDTNRWRMRHEPQPPSPATLEAIERALAGSLEDTEECFNTSFSRNEQGLTDPRICDLAAWFLSDRWPARYSFEVPGSLESRNRQRIECLNSWRAAHHLPLLPVPQPKPQPPRARVARDEATRVTAIDWSEDSAGPRPAFAARVVKLKDKRLNPRDVVGLLTFFAGHPEPNAMGLELRAYKDADLTGVRVVARLIPGTPPAPTGTVGWDVSQHVVLGSNMVQGSSGGGVLDAYTEAQAWADLEGAIKQAVSAPAETPFEISARIVGSGGTRITRPGR